MWIIGGFRKGKVRDSSAPILQPLHTGIRDDLRHGRDGPLFDLLIEIGSLEASKGGGVENVDEGSRIQRRSLLVQGADHLPKRQKVEIYEPTHKKVVARSAVLESDPP